LDYEPLVGRSAIEEISLLAEKLSGKVVQNINSTRSGGGVAEVLSRMVPLLQQVGVEAQWNVIKGNQEFFQVTKKFHNALQGKEESISPEEFSLLLEPSQGTVEEYLHGDIIFIHDPQPIALIAKRRELGEKWVWRCHIDVSNPRPEAWDFVREFVVQYDAAVFSTASFSHELPMRQFLIPPSIDPLSEKNKELSGDEIESVLAAYGIPQDKPIITQVSRFDHLKDPIGVIRAFEMVRRDMDCRLVLAGGTAVDDPEADKVLAEVKERTAGIEDIHVLSLPPESGSEINALQRASTVVLQKSLKEGFGLTVSEALWKGKPVVVSAVGGMRLQVKDRFNGLLCHGVEGAAYALRLLLSNPEYARWLGENGREHVRRNFLITRHLKEYLLLFLSLYHPEDIIYL